MQASRISSYTRGRSDGLANWRMIHSEERFPCLEKAREATLEVAKEETPKAEGSKEESKAAMIFGHREKGAPVLNIMQEQSSI